jgi:hypothetical protein
VRRACVMDQCVELPAKQGVNVTANHGTRRPRRRDDPIRRRRVAESGQGELCAGAVEAFAWYSWDGWPDDLI